MPTDRSAADELLVVALASGKTIKDAAAAAGVSETTAKRRVKAAGFRRRVADARGQMIAAAAGQLAANMTAAADALVALLADPDANVRLKAADKVLSHAVRTAELVDLECRVQELERAAEPPGDGHEANDQAQDAHAGP